MPLFQYMAKDQGGKTIQGEIMAGASHEAIQLLRSQDLLVTRRSWCL